MTYISRRYPEQSTALMRPRGGADQGYGTLICLSYAVYNVSFSCSLSALLIVPGFYSFPFLVKIPMCQVFEITIRLTECVQAKRDITSTHWQLEGNVKKT